MKYNLKQLDNEHNNAHLLWFPKAVRTDTLNLRGLSDHISDHGSIYTRDVVQGVLTKFTMCMIELLKQGVAVKLDGLGTFHMELESKGAESVEAFTAATNIRGFKLRARATGNYRKAALKQVATIKEMDDYDGTLTATGADDENP